MLRLDSPPSSWTVALSVLVLTVIAHLLRKASEHKARSRGRPLPPGPRALPIVGNLFDVPKVRPWEAYRELSRKHGCKIVSLNVMGRRLVVIDDAEVAIELLQKRSANYSSKPASVIFEMCGWMEWNIALLPCTQRWRWYRRTFWQHFQPGAVDRYRAHQEQGARRLVSRLLSSGLADSEKVIESIRYTLGEMHISTSYGLQAADAVDKYAAMFEELLASVDILLTGSTRIIEFVPLLARVPTWLPGIGVLLRRIAYYRELTTEAREAPWADAKDAIASGTASESVASALFEGLSSPQGSQGKDSDASTQEETIKNVLAIAPATGVDTTHAALRAFFVAMILYPDVQRKAQAELDAVVGEGRLPQFADRGSLPYVNAVMKEVLRWHPVSPLSIPHVNVSDDEYEGYFIPKDSIVMANVWSMFHDEDEYPQPDQFIPERFLRDGQPRSDVRDPATLVFGFGRRICPGRYYADATLFIYIASILHTLDIAPPVDEQGHPVQIEVNTRLISGVVSHLEDWKCTLKARRALP
ncbi:cytochrome P450 [Daedaleopsis nitida]|nr:cytochrome P450 [Daedaleopsis nitida]